MNSEPIKFEAIEKEIEKLQEKYKDLESQKSIIEGRILEVHTMIHILNEILDKHKGV
jgi:predicted  nucleic acid-binding Zn-ribbon protein